MPVCTKCGFQVAHNYDIKIIKELIDNGWVLARRGGGFITDSQFISDADELTEKTFPEFHMGRCSYGYCPMHAYMIGDNMIPRTQS